MHDIDRVLFEVTGETYGEVGTSGEEEVFGEEETYETYGEVFGEEETYETPDREVFETYGEVVGEGTSQEIALASELLEITTEDELDRFLGAGRDPEVCRAEGTSADRQGGRRLHRAGIGGRRWPTDRWMARQSVRTRTSN
jgi:hypothetical protein